MNTEVEQLILEIYQDTTPLIKNTSYYLGLPWFSWQRICLRIQETQETRVQSLGQEDPVEKEMTTHSSMLAWRILWTEEPDGL